MSSASSIGTDHLRTDRAHLYPQWRRRSSTGVSDGGSAYGEFLCLLNSMRLSLNLKRDDKCKEFIGCLNTKSNGDIHLMIRAAIRSVRRTDFSQDALEKFVGCVSEIAIRTNVATKHDRHTRLNATLLLRGFNTYINGAQQRLEATAIACCCAALLSERVHFVSNDNERARLLADYFSPLYELLGLKYGYVAGGQATERRQISYQNQIIHVGAETLAADHLTDTEITGIDRFSLRTSVNLLAKRELEHKRIVLHGASWLFVDEGDITLGTGSTRIVTLAGDQGFFEETVLAEETIALSRQFDQDIDFHIDGSAVTLTDRGQRKAAAVSIQFSPLWNGPQRRDELLRVGLSALHIYHKGADYDVEKNVIKPLNVDLIEEMRGYKSAVSLQTLLAAKEGLANSREQRVHRRKALRSVLQQYPRISAASCPGAAMAGELWSVYHLQSVDIRPLFGKRMFDTTVIVGPDPAKLNASAAILNKELSADESCMLATKAGDLDDIRTIVVRENPDVDIFDRLALITFDDTIIDKMRILAGPTNAVLTDMASEDEKWRRVIDELRWRCRESRICIAISNDDDIFYFLPKEFTSKIVWRIVMKSGFLMRIYVHLALRARRTSFSNYRMAHLAHDKSINRMLAFMGGA